MWLWNIIQILAQINAYVDLEFFSNLSGDKDYFIILFVW